MYVKFAHLVNVTATAYLPYYL